MSASSKPGDVLYGVLSIARFLRAEEAETARLSFDLSGPVESRARALAEPERIVIDLPEVDFHIDPAVGRIAAPRAGALI